MPMPQPGGTFSKLPRRPAPPLGGGGGVTATVDPSQFPTQTAPTTAPGLQPPQQRNLGQSGMGRRMIEHRLAKRQMGGGQAPVTPRPVIQGFSPSGY